MSGKNPRAGRSGEVTAEESQGKISEAEFLAGGREGLPSFEGYKDLGRESHLTC